MEYIYKTKGTCSTQIKLNIEDDVITDVSFTGGCNGNLKAIAKLVHGQRIDDVIALLEGNTCGPRSTSCADQMCHALREARQAG